MKQTPRAAVPSNAHTQTAPSRTQPPTLRSCMRQFMMPRKFPLARVARVLPLAMYSSYSWRWRLDSLRYRAVQAGSTAGQ